MCDTEAGSRYYRLTLNLPTECNGGNIANNYVLNLDGYVDNWIDNIFINGIPTGITASGFWAGVKNNIVLQGLWVPGQNFVDVLVRNEGGPGGLLMVANTTLGNLSLCITSSKTTICTNLGVCNKLACWLCVVVVHIYSPFWWLACRFNRYCYSFVV